MEDPAEKVFKNRYLVSNILNFLADDQLKFMKLRSVSKVFNTECLGFIRKNFLSVIIHYKNQGYIYLPQDFDENRIFINFLYIEMDRVLDFFKFLIKVASVKIRKIEVKELWKMTEEQQKALHKYIKNQLISKSKKSLKTLIGMEDICPNGCKICLESIEQFVEYGPIQHNFFERKLKNKQHFDTLIMNDFNFDEIAMKCITNLKTKKECFEILDKMIFSDVSCDHFILNISEQRALPGHNRSSFERIMDIGTYHHVHKPIPLDILEMILKKWRVKSIGLKFKEWTRIEIFDDRWTKNDYFKKFCFNQRDDIIYESSLKFSSVEIDLEDSFQCFWDDNDHGYSSRRAVGFSENLISNVRKLFSTDTIVFSKIRKMWTVPNRKVFEYILRSIQFEKQLNLTVKYDIYSEVVPDIDFLNWFEHKQNPSEFSMLNRKFEMRELNNPVISYFRDVHFLLPIHFGYPVFDEPDTFIYSMVDEKRIGKKFIIYEKANNCRIELTCSRRKHLKYHQSDPEYNRRFNQSLV